MQTMYPGKVNSPATLLTEDINDIVTTIAVEALECFPDPPNTATIGETWEAETILYTGKSAPDGEGYLTGVTREFQGVANSWPAGTRIARTFTAYDFDSLRQNVESMEAVTGTAGENLAQYNVVYLKSDGKWYKASALDSTKIGGRVGVTKSAITSNNTGTIQTQGLITNPSWSFNVGKLVFIGDTLGGASTSPGTYARILGTAITTTSMVMTQTYNINPIQAGIVVQIPHIYEITQGTQIPFSCIYETVYPIVSYDWDFGDGSIHSSLSAPIHAYTSGGTYNVSVILTDTQGNKCRTAFSLNIRSIQSTDILGGMYGDDITGTYYVKTDIPERNELYGASHYVEIQTSDYLEGNAASHEVRFPEVFQELCGASHSVVITNNV